MAVTVTKRQGCAKAPRKFPIVGYNQQGFTDGNFRSLDAVCVMKIEYERSGLFRCALIATLKSGTD